MLRLADAHDVAVCLHTDGLNESCELRTPSTRSAGGLFTRTTWRAPAAATSPT